MISLSNSFNIPNFNYYFGIIIGEKEMTDNILNLIMYSAYDCYPERESKENEHIFSGKGNEIPEEILELLIDRISKHVDKNFTKSTVECAIKTENPILKRAIESRRIDDWRNITDEIADKYTNSKRAKNAILMISKFIVNQENFVCILRYRLTPQIQYDENESQIEKLKRVERILEEETSKSAIYPSVNSIDSLQIDSNMVKIHDSNETEHFRETIDIEELPPHKQIDKELKNLYDEANKSGNPMKLSNIIEELRMLIERSGRISRRSISKKIIIRSGSIKIEADFSKLFNEIQIDRVDQNSQKISITGPNATIRFVDEEYEINT